LNIAYRYFPAR